MDSCNSGYKEFNRKQGLLLKKARKAANFSQQDVANLLDVRQEMVSKYETGKSIIPSYHLLKFSRIYQKPITFFYMDTPD